MADSLSAIFKDGLFVTKKNPNRDWTQIADRAGSHLYTIVCEEFANPEIALCALVNSLAEVVLCQTEKGKREKLVKHLPDAILECVKRIEASESDEPYEYEGEEEEQEEDDEPEGPGKPGEEVEEEQEEVDFEGPKQHPVLAAMSNPPERPSPEPTDDDDDDLGDDDPNESAFNNNPAKLAGFQKKPPKRK